MRFQQQKYKKNENAKMRCIENKIIGSQMPFIGSVIWSQVAAGNKSDCNHNVEDTDVSTNLTPVSKTIHHKKKDGYTSIQRKRKNCSPTPSADFITLRIDGMRSIIQSTMECDTSSMEDCVAKTVETILNLQKVRKKWKREKKTEDK